MKIEKLPGFCKNCSKLLPGRTKCFCSALCYNEQRVSLAQKGDKSPAWKGDNAGYTAKHHWVKKYYGKQQECEECGLKEIPTGMKRYFDWANISGEYKRERSDWKRLCKLCHKKLDSSLVKRGEHQGSSKLTDRQVRIMKWALHYGKDLHGIQKCLAGMFNVTEAAISSIKKHKNWKHLIIETK